MGQQLDKNWNSDKTQKLKLLQNKKRAQSDNKSKTQIVTKIKNSNCDKSQIAKTFKKNCGKTQKL